MSGFLKAFVGLWAFGAALGLVFGIFQSVHPAMDSFSHFRVHFLVVLAVCALLWLVVGGGTGRRIAGAAVVTSIVVIAWMWREGPPYEAPRGDLRLVTFNVNYRNPQLEEVDAALAEMEADVVTLQEITQAHEAALRKVSAFPHQVHCLFSEKVGRVSILSKHPISAETCATGQGLVTATLDVPGGPVTVASIHTYWPWPFEQHAQIDRWVPVLKKIEGPVIVAGDFNAAPWSDAVRKIMNASRTQAVPGVRMTIAVKRIKALPAIPIPIDHVLLSKEFCALATRVGPTLGSDHSPVIVEIARGPSKRCSPH